MKEWLSIKECMSLTGKSKSTIHRMLRSVRTDSSINENKVLSQEEFNGAYRTLINRTFLESHFNLKINNPSNTVDASVKQHSVETGEVLLDYINTLKEQLKEANERERNLLSLVNKKDSFIQELLEYNAIGTGLNASQKPITVEAASVVERDDNAVEVGPNGEPDTDVESEEEDQLSYFRKKFGTK